MNKPSSWVTGVLESAAAYIKSFFKYVGRCLQKFAVFKGRATRAEYWCFILFSFLLDSVLYPVMINITGTETADIVTGFVLICLFIPSVSVGVRRLHDINFKGWWILISITIIGLIPLWIMYCLPGKPEKNRFGSREV